MTQKFNRTLSAILATGMLFAIPATGLAKPARRGFTSVTQPDGSTLSIQKTGDEYNHLITTEDGLPVIETEAGYVYLTLADDGSNLPTAILAHDITSRTQEEKDFISRIDSDRLAAQIAERPARRLPAGTKLSTRGPGLMSSTFPCHGEQRGLVVLVEYRDVKFSIDYPNEFYTSMLNDEGFNMYSGVGSARDYFIDNSNGIFTPIFDVYGPVTLKYNMSRYGANNKWGDDAYAYQMAIEACQLLDDTVDFSQYDRDGDGEIDNIYIFYAGYGEADYNASNTVWPHSWSLDEAIPSGPKYIFDGVRLNKYACSNELDGSSPYVRPDGIGTFVHEFSHVLGLPDLYQTANGQGTPFTPGEYSVLDYGPYNGGGSVPPRYSAYERYALDWLTPVELNSTCNITLPPIEENVAYIIRTERENEYYLLENRQMTWWDALIPYHGMLVWHIDYDEQTFTDNNVNNNASHQYVDLVEADNLQTDNSVTGDPFPGTAFVSRFATDTRPTLKSWGNQPLAITAIENITEDYSTGLISFRAVNPNDANSIGEISASTERADVFSPDGRLVLASASEEEAALLAPGLYIRAGKKFIVR